jgi:hypothetical protein
MGQFYLLFWIIVLLLLLRVVINKKNNQSFSDIFINGFNNQNKNENHFNWDNPNNQIKIVNEYYEYRQWVFFWGLFLDQKHELRKILKEYNEKGWHVIQFEWAGIPKMNIVKLLFIWAISIFTLGFVSYWVGFSIVFDKKIND